MFLRQRYKLLTLQKISSSVSKILKLNRNLLSVEMTDDEENISPVYQDEEKEITNMIGSISKKQTEKIAEFVTTVDIECDRGVDALHHILNLLIAGFPVREAVKSCENMLHPNEKKSRRDT